MTFSIIKRKKNPLGLIPNFIWGFLLSFISFTLSFRLVKNSFIDLYIVIFFCIFLGIFIYKFADIEKLNAKTIGKITFHENEIVLSGKTIYLKDIQYLHLRLKNYRYELQNITRSLKPMYFIGKNNYFKIITIHNEVFEGEFVILSRYDFLKLQMWNKEYYQLRFQQSIT